MQIPVQRAIDQINKTIPGSSGDRCQLFPMGHHIGIVGGLLLLLLAHTHNGLQLLHRTALYFIVPPSFSQFGKFGHDQYNLRQQKQDLKQRQEQTDTDGNGVSHHNPSLFMPTARTIPPQG